MVRLQWSQEFGPISLLYKRFIVSNAKTKSVLANTKGRFSPRFSPFLPLNASSHRLMNILDCSSALVELRTGSAEMDVVCWCDVPLPSLPPLSRSLYHTSGVTPSLNLEKGIQAMASCHNHAVLFHLSFLPPSRDRSANEPGIHSFGLDIISCQRAASSSVESIHSTGIP